MILTCTKCGSHNIYTVGKEGDPNYVQKEKTIDEFVKTIHEPVPAVYILTTLKCKDCGYSVSY